MSTVRGSWMICITLSRLFLWIYAVDSGYSRRLSATCGRWPSSPHMLSSSSAILVQHLSEWFISSILFENSVQSPSCASFTSVSDSLFSPFNSDTFGVFTIGSLELLKPWGILRMDGSIWLFSELQLATCAARTWQYDLQGAQMWCPLFLKRPSTIPQQ